MIPRRYVKVLSCLSPLIGMAVLFAIGWIIDIILPNDVLTAATSRFLMLVAGVVGWALGVLLRSYRLHCGGTRKLLPLSPEAARRLVQLAVVFALCMTIVFISLLAKLPVFALGSLAILLASIVGEVGWGKPFCGMERLW